MSQLLRLGLKLFHDFVNVKVVIIMLIANGMERDGGYGGGGGYLICENCSIHEIYEKHTKNVYSTVLVDPISFVKYLCVVRCILCSPRAVPAFETFLQSNFDPRYYYTLSFDKVCFSDLPRTPSPYKI